MQLEKQKHLDINYHAEDNDYTKSSPAAAEEEEEPAFKGAPKGWKPPGPPEKFDAASKIKGDCPAFWEVDNPGNWDEHCFQPKCNTAKDAKTKVTTHKCTHHALPGGAQVVPLCKSGPNKGKRMAGDMEFIYNGSWTSLDVDMEFRDGATIDNLFPDCRKGSLDGGLLAKLGLTADATCAPR